MCLIDTFKPLGKYFMETLMGHILFFNVVHVAINCVRYGEMWTLGAFSLILSFAMNSNAVRLFMDPSYKVHCLVLVNTEYLL